jgi:hypothetical protein
LEISPLRNTTEKFYFPTEHLHVYSLRNILFDKRMGLSFTIAAALSSAVILKSEFCGIRDHILLSHIRDSPNLEGQVTIFISPRKRVARLYPQALGCLFVTSYDSQDHDGVFSSETLYI